VLYFTPIHSLIEAKPSPNLRRSSKVSQ